jgi:protein arginine kinase activator
MICQNCHKNKATVTVLEIQPSTPESAPASTPSSDQQTGQASDEQDGPETQQPAKGFQEQQLCEICAQSKNLPHAPVMKKSLGDIWKLLQTSSKQAAKVEDVVCPDCGMTREEFRRKGRVGCAGDYELFSKDIAEILERVHGATRHTGRLPGVSDDDLTRMEEIVELKKRLQTAIHDEAYENAARIRDELQGLGG